MSTRASPRNILLPCLCLLLSGASALAYEMVWIRRMSLIFGTTLHAISAVLCAFMSGLALGAWGASLFLQSEWIRKTAARHSLVKIYGLLELAIGLYALALPLLLNLLESAYPLAIAALGGQSRGLLLIEFIAGALLMLPATVLMGATLPILGSWAVGNRMSELVPDVSLLYGLNTAGAVAGCLLTQFYGIRLAGLDGVTWLAAASNAVIFLLCQLVPTPPSSLVRDLPDFDQPLSVDGRRRSETAFSRPLAGLFLALFAFSGMTSLASEMLWTRILVFPMGTTLYSFALILAAFLSGISIGSLLAGKLPGKNAPVMQFLLLELAAGAVGLSMIPLFDHLTEWTLSADRLLYAEDNTPGRTLAIRSLFAFGFMLPPTLIFGMIFPLANRILSGIFQSAGRTLSSCYAVNTAGSVLGTLLTPFLFIPVFGIRGSLFLLNTVIVLASLTALLLFNRWKPSRSLAAAASCIAALWIAYSGVNPEISRDTPGKGNLARIEINSQADRIRLLDYHEGENATLGIVEDKETQARTLYLDGFSTATVTQSQGGSAYMQAMAFVPMMLHRNPERTLVICFGTGSTAGAAAVFPQSSIDIVELDPAVLKMAHWFSRWNRDVLQRRNVRTHIQDGRNFIRWTENSYDVITLEPMSPVQAGVNSLYSREFYESAANRLKPGGVMLQWLPLHLVTPADARAIIKTFREVFPHVSVWNSFLTRIVLLAGSRERIVVDKVRFDQLMQNPEVQAMAGQIHVNSFLDFTDFYLADGSSIAPFADSGETITDNHPILEFSEATLLPPLQWQTDESFLNILLQRVNRPPETAGLTPEEKGEWEQAMTLRTAQRLAVFSRRYDGPGATLFAAGDMEAGLKAVAGFIHANGGSPISLRRLRWDVDGKTPGS